MKHVCQWQEWFKEPTYTPLSPDFTDIPKFKEFTYIQHSYCTICDKTKEVHQPSGIERKW